ncbi:MAG: peptidoglycan bridge formation glycyltransferase FemA/FemB family protein [Candidatus Moranbacteria bacterium]|jgi:lipid II:glycine glycyltransferase (peptidoglycan interpeptide bridge formation enzyme)|nr:peptidoglycan bridge formation glycyltransferase FemA/FemB family protein [Candidatus Moranbacteria bacterium]
MDFLQSEDWRKFQESVGCRTFGVFSGGFSVSIIEHKLPIVGNYFYAPRGFVIPAEAGIQDTGCKFLIKDIFNLAKKEKVNWIRFDAKNKDVLRIMEDCGLKVEKAPHDMQPSQTFVIDISKPEEKLLEEMKSKTRYNIRLSEKRGVIIFNFQFSILKQFSNSNDKILNKENKENKEKFSFYANEFLRLVRITSKRQGIVSHPDEYYRKMLEIPCVQLYVAEFDGKVVAVAVVSFFEGVATYLHGASDDRYKNVMAPFALHWKIIKDAKEKGYKKYDMGGVSVNFQSLISNVKKEKIQNSSNWAGITRFKLGFSPETKPTEFAGSYDIIIDQKKYFLYKFLQFIKGLMK